MRRKRTGAAGGPTFVAAVLVTLASACRALLGIDDPGSPAAVDPDASAAVDAIVPGSDAPGPGVLDAAPDALTDDTGSDAGTTFCSRSTAAFCEDFDRGDLTLYTSQPKQIPGSTVTIDEAGKSSPRAIVVTTKEQAVVGEPATLVTFRALAPPASGSATSVVVDFDLRVDQAMATNMAAVGATVVWIRDANAALGTGAQLVHGTDTNFVSAFRVGGPSGPIVDLVPKTGQSWVHVTLRAPLGSIGNGRISADNGFMVESPKFSVEGSGGPVLVSIGARGLPSGFRISTLKLAFDNVEVRFD